MPQVSHPVGEERAKQLKNSLITHAFELGMGDIKRTGALIRDAFADATFQFFLAECLTPEQAVDKVCMDNICGFLDSLGREEGGQGRLQNEPEQLRRLFVMAITGKRRLPVPVQNRIADRLHQDRRYVKKIHALGTQIWAADGSFLDVTKAPVSKERNDKRADDPIIMQGWHEFCTMKKGMGQTKKQWLPLDKRTEEHKFEEHDALIQTETDWALYQKFLAWEKYKEW